jgi:hypothetical protein
MILRRIRTAVAMCTVLVCVSVPPALAHDAADSTSTAVTSKADLFAPRGAHDDPYNGYRVYLSSPRHRESGRKGECRNPGLEENVNGRRWNWLAANGTHIGDRNSPTIHARNLHARGYAVTVSPNSRDNGYLQNLHASRNWGADLHIVTHSNGIAGCPSHESYLLTMWSSATDKALATTLGWALDPVVPGGRRGWQRTNLAELGTNAPRGDAYVELQFHDNPTAQAWIYRRSVQNAWRYGYAVDRYLGYP